MSSGLISSICSLLNISEKHLHKPLYTLLLACTAFADTAYYHRVIFDNSINLGRYFYTEGRASAPSRLELLDARLPVEHERFHTPPNALRLHWTSAPQGGWTVAVILYEFRNREVFFPGTQLTFWCYSANGLRANAWPSIALHDSAKNFTRPFPVR